MMAGSGWRPKWPIEVLQAFVDEQINHYPYEMSPEETREHTPPWKRWLWLEKHGYDFAYHSIAAEIFSFRMSEDPSGALPAEERGVLLEIRGVMREILGLEPLSEEQRTLFLATVPLSNHAHWASVRRPLGPADTEPAPDRDFPNVLAFAWKFLAEDKPDYVRILREAVQYDDASPERFVDTFTKNGDYSLSLYDYPSSIVMAQVVRHHLRVSADLFLQPGNLKRDSALFSYFLNYVRDRVQEQDQ